MAATGALSGAFIGALADKVGYRRLTTFALFILAVAGLLGGFAQGPIVLLISRFFEGIGYASILVCAPPMIVRASEVDNRDLPMAIWSCAVPSGMTLMLLVSPLFLANCGWRSLWFSNSALISLLLLVFIIGTRDLRGCAADESCPGGIGIWWEIKTTLSKPGPALLTLLFILYSLQFMAVMGFLPILLIDKLNVVQTTAALLTALMVSCNIGGNLVGGELLKWGWRRSQIIIASSMTMLLAALLIYVGKIPPTIGYLATLFFSAAGGMIPVCLMAGIPYHAPNPALVGTTSGIVMQGAMMGATLGPPFVAFAVDTAGGWHGALWVLLSTGGLSVVTAMYLGYLGKIASRSRQAGTA
jgi:MFS family permease